MLRTEGVRTACEVQQVVDQLVRDAKVPTVRHQSALYMGWLVPKQRAGLNGRAYAVHVKSVRCT